MKRQQHPIFVHMSDRRSPGHIWGPASDPGKPDEPDRHGEATVEEAKPRLKRPPMYKVLMLNDDYTPMDFVVEAALVARLSATEAYAPLPRRRSTQPCSSCTVPSRPRSVLTYTWIRSLG